MNRIKIFKYLIVFFLFLNFATLIFGYHYFINFNNLKKDWYNEQILLNKKKEDLILKEINIINNSIINITNNLIKLEDELVFLKTSHNLKNKDITSLKNLNSLKNELNLLNKEENKLKQEKENLYLQYLRKQERKASRTTTTTNTS